MTRSSVPRTRTTWLEGALHQAKLATAGLLGSAPVGRFLRRAFGDSVPSFTGNHYVPTDERFDKVRARVCIGTYESAERRLVSGLAANHRSILELGGSIGVVGAVALRVAADDAVLVSVEANPSLLAPLKVALNRALGREQCMTVVGAAIYYEGTTAQISLAADTAASSVYAATEVQVEVPSTTLAELIEEHHLPSPRLLIADIEGVEHETLRQEREILGNFDTVVVELHDRPGLSFEETSRAFTRGMVMAGFRLEAIDGRVFAYVKTSVPE